MVTKLNSITSTFPAVQPTKFWDSNKSYLAEEFLEVQENQQSGYEFDSGITSALPQQTARIPQVSSVASLPRFPFPPTSPSHMPAVHGPQTTMSHQSVPSAIEDDSAASAQYLKVFIAMQETLGTHLQLLSNLDVQLSRMFLDRAIVQQRCYDEHTRLLALFRRILPSILPSLPIEFCVPPSQLASVPSPNLMQSSVDVRVLRRELTTEHDAIRSGYPAP